MGAATTANAPLALAAEQPSQRQRVEAYLANQARLDTLRFITCGSVDDGKSTLIGRLLFEAQLLFEDQVTQLEHDSKAQGTQGGDIDFALLVDGLAAEREQGITIDVAYRFFNTDRRKFIVADTPGHEQYTRNMATGASTADVAVILVDAQSGVLTQTRRHSFICSLLGIRHVVLAINKMDLVGFDENVYHRIVDDYVEFAEHLEFASISSIPVSALNGDNVIEASPHTPWYSGPTLLNFLETVSIEGTSQPAELRFPVQWVNRPSADFRGYTGTVVAGSVTPGMPVVALPSGATANVNEVLLYNDSLDRGITGQALTLTLDREIDVSRGDVLVAAEQPPAIADEFEAELVWMDAEPGYIGRTYALTVGTARVNAQLTGITHQYNVNTMERHSTDALQLNDIARVRLSLDRPVPFEPYRNNRGLGALVLVDKLSNATVGAGMVISGNRRDVIHQNLAVDQAARERLNGHKARAIWFTGLSRAGKTVLANRLEQALHSRGVRTFVLDGENVRQGLSRDLGFTEADRVEHVRRLAQAAKLMVEAGVVVLVTAISPFRAERRAARELFADGEFVEVFLDVPVTVAAERDPKGLYEKANRGELPDFTGVTGPFEAPEHAELTLSTDCEDEAACVQQLLSFVDSLPG